MTTSDRPNREGQSDHISSPTLVLPSRPSSSSLSRSVTTPSACRPTSFHHGTAKRTRRASSLPRRRRFSVEASTESLFRAVEEEGENGYHGSNKEDDGAHQSKMDSHKFYGAYADIRRTKIDYSYHVCYRKERQWLHDSIIVDILENAVTAATPDRGEERIGQTKGDDEDDTSSVKLMERTTASANHERRDRTSPYSSDDDGGSGGEEEDRRCCEQKRGQTCHPWFILTAGPQGAGKRYTIDCLVKTCRWPFSSLVVVDADEIRRYLPEYTTYVDQVPHLVDRLTQKEAGYVAETLVWAALQEGRSVVLDSSLKDAAWHVRLVDRIRADHAHYKVALIQVSCPDYTLLLERAKLQSKETGREVPYRVLVYQTENVTRSVDVVSPVVDQYCVIRNDAEGLRLVDGCSSWEEFSEAFQPHHDAHWTTGHTAEYSPLTCSPSRKRRSLRRISILRSSEENHKSEDMNFYGKFAHLRKKLDYAYHCNYTFERQMFQDAVIDHFLKAAVIKDKNGELCTTPTEPWIVFTAGAMGAGKSHTMRILVEKGRFPLLAFVNVDPDRIRYFIPEFLIYLEENAELAGELTRKEAGLMAEILTLAGLQAGKNVLVDGSLRDHDWYRQYFERLRSEFPMLRIAILHVTAPPEAVFQRAEERALVTGRVVPRDLLAKTLEQVPQSVRILAPLVDYHVELRNASDSDDIELVTEGETWETFKSHWIQTCAWLPSQRLLKKLSKRAESSNVSNGSSEGKIGDDDIAAQQSGVGTRGSAVF